MAANKLTQKQVMFIQYYFQVLNASKAARMAGYSVRSAANIGYDNMKRTHVGGVIRKMIRSREYLKYRMDTLPSYKRG